MSTSNDYTLDPNLTKTTPLNVAADRAKQGTGSSEEDAHATAVAKAGKASQDVKAGEKLGNEAMTQPETPLAEDVASIVKPETDELNALPSEYESVMKAIGAMPDSGTATPVNPAVAGAPGEAANNANAAALSSAEGTVTANMEGGEAAIAKALGGEGKAAKTLVQDLPYADILATTLNAKKNELLYGTTPSPGLKPVDETNWSKNVQQIYSYIQGGSTGNTQVTGGATTPGIGSLTNVNDNSGLGGITAPSYSGTS